MIVSLAALAIIAQVTLAGSPKPATCGKPAFPTVPEGFFLDPLPKEHFSLIQAHVFYRHGDRLPWQAQQCWTADQLIGHCEYTDYMEPDFGFPLHSPDRKFVFRRRYDDQNDCEVGQMTTYGFFQEINNGEILRKAYIEDNHLVGKAFNASEVFVRSTNVHRTIDSTQAVISGMFEAQGDGAQIVDIHTHDAAFDLLTVNGTLTAVTEQSVANLPGYQDWYDSKAVPVMKKIQNALGVPVTSMTFVEEMFDCTTVHACHDKSTPFDDELIKEIAIVYTEWYIWLYSNPTRVYFGKQASGYVINFMVEKMAEIMSNPDATKLYLNCGHDTGPMLTLLVALNLPVTHWPAYGSMFAFELWQELSSQDYFVRILYDGVPQVVEQCKGSAGQKMQQNFSEGLCTLKEFQTIAAMFQSQSTQ